MSCTTTRLTFEGFSLVLHAIMLAASSPDPEYAGVRPCHFSNDTGRSSVDT